MRGCTERANIKSVYIPGPEDEAIRDLSRAREDAVIAAPAARGAALASRRALSRQNAVDAGTPAGGTTRGLRDRGEGQPQVVRGIAWKAQPRLCRKYRRLLAKGKVKQIVTTAIARELVGFVWAIAKEVSPRDARSQCEAAL